MTKYIQKIHLHGGGTDRFGTEVYPTASKAWEDLDEFIVDWNRDNQDAETRYTTEDFAVLPVEISFVGQIFNPVDSKQLLFVTKATLINDEFMEYHLTNLTTDDEFYPDWESLARDFTPHHDDPSRVYADHGESKNRLY